MKKILALILIVTMTVSLLGCGAEDPNLSEVIEASEMTEVSEVTELPEETEMSGQTDGQPTGETEEEIRNEASPLELAQGIYQALNMLATATDMVGSDICQAWYTAILDEDNVVSGGAAYLADKLAMSEDELREGVAHMAFSETGGDWTSIIDEQWKELRQKDSLFAEAQENDALFDCCINVVWSAYLELNFYDNMDENMPLVKEAIRKLIEIDPENEYIGPLKEYYGVIRSYLEWCEVPDGSYNEAEELLNSYVDSYRSYRDALEFDLGE